MSNEDSNSNRLNVQPEPTGVGPQDLELRRQAIWATEAFYTHSPATSTELYMQHVKAFELYLKTGEIPNGSR